MEPSLTKYVDALQQTVSVKNKSEGSKVNLKRTDINNT